MGQLNTIPLHSRFGAEVSGFDLNAPIDAANAAELRSILDEYSLVCFRDQAIDDEAHLRLTRALGEPEPNHVKLGATGEVDYLATIGNVIDADNHKGNDDPHTRYQSGNNLWHTDASFQPTPAKFSINHAYEVPGEGGDTEFVSQRVAYAELDEAQRVVIDELKVLHDYVFSRSKVAPVDPNHAAQFPPVEHRLVRCNPTNGRRNYYVGSHARSIVGYGGVEGRKLIDDLVDFATEPDRVYRHQWRVGDTLIWDNRCLLHRGLGFDADRWRRLLRQTRVKGDAPTIDE